MFPNYPVGNVVVAVLSSERERKINLRAFKLTIKP